ncbi:MAG: signal recognition particle [Bacteroidetes bacterium]|nr:signal recognition particle [Bacteroidota bacterium]
MKKIVLIFSFILIALKGWSQNKESISSANIEFIDDSTVKYSVGDIDFINNSTIKYDAVLLACDTCVPIKNIGFRIILQLYKNQYKTIKNINAKEWLRLLNQKSTDFAANIILYSIYDKDATVISAFATPEKWRRVLKDDDLKYWESILVAK